jgi:hypothetical protein
MSDAYKIDNNFYFYLLLIFINFKIFFLRRFLNMLKTISDFHRENISTTIKIGICFIFKY